MDLLWIALLGAFFLLTAALAVVCDRLLPRR
jgi:hypothetical protein